MTGIDPSNPPAGHKVSVKVEREESDEERAHRLRKDFILFIVAVGFFVIASVLCVVGILIPQLDADLKKTAAHGLYLLGGGVVGYLVRRESSR